MKKTLLLLILIPLLVNAQSRKKKYKAELANNAAITANLKAHIQYLADDKLEGRRTGTAGEVLAMQYISHQYELMGIPPAGSTGYVQEFDIDEGKQPVEANTYIIVNNQMAELYRDYYPLAYSGTGTAAGNPSVALNESGQPWFRDVREVLEENQNNPHFDIMESIRNSVVKAAKKGATAFLVYNSSNITDNILYDKHDKSATASIPVFYITKEGFKKYFSDVSATISLKTGVAFIQKIRKARNVIAFIDNKAANTVILGAHYDHLGYGEDKNALDTGHVIHNGADDNASGTAGLIELARMLKKSAPVSNNYLILHFSGEELGLLGSKYWLEHPTLSVNPNYMINMDMVGRYDSTRKLTIGGYGTSPAWGDLFKTVTDNRLAIKFDSAGTGPSDHEAFYRKSIPVLFFFTGSHPDYHKATDDWDKINYDSEREILQYIYQLIKDLDTKGKLAFLKTREEQAGRGSRYTVSLGIMPDYGFTGTGVRADGIVPGKLAERTGLQAGDIIVQLGEYKFVDVMSYMQTLGKFKKGDKTSLVIKRNNKEITYNIEF